MLSSDQMRSVSVGLGRATIVLVFAVLAALPLLSTLVGLASIVAGLFTLTAGLLLKRG